MTIEIDTFWFLIPTFCSLVSIWWFPNYYSNNGDFGLGGVIDLGVSIIVTLVSWLIYFIIF